MNPENINHSDFNSLIWNNTVSPSRNPSKETAAFGLFFISSVNEQPGWISPVQFDSSPCGQRSMDNRASGELQHGECLAWGWDTPGEPHKTHHSQMFPNVLMSPQRWLCSPYSSPHPRKKYTLPYTRKDHYLDTEKCIWECHTLFLHLGLPS